MAEDKTVKKGTKSNQAQGPSTGFKKALNAPDKEYNQPVKGSGKPKYQNVVKEARLDTKKRTVDITTHVKQNLVGKKVTAQEKRAIGNKAENTAKLIDREHKVEKGVRTESPSTPKVPVKGGAKAKGTQAGHAVTDSANHTKPVSRGRGGGLGGGFAGGNMEFPEQIK